MAKEFPRIAETNPVLTGVNVSSSAQGYEAFAKTLGSLSEHAFEKVQEIQTEQSQSMYINSVANVEQYKAGAHMRMLEHPDQAGKIAEQTYEGLDLVEQAAYVNGKDRARLKAYISGARDDVALKATGIEVNQRTNQAAFTHYAGWPDQLRAYKDALLTDPVQAEHLKEAMVGSLRGLIDVGAMTPLQANSQLKSMQDVVQLAQDHYEYMKMGMSGGDVNAKDYHTLVSSPLNNEPAPANSPTNQDTAWLTNYHNQDKTFTGLMASITNRQMNPIAFDNATPDQRQEALMTMQGVREADGMINSGEPFPSINKKYKDLTQEHVNLSYKDKGLRSGLASYINDLKNGNYLQAIARTPGGNAIMQNYTMKDTAIRNSPIDTDKKEEFIKQNKDEMINAAVSYGEGHHIPHEYIQPIPAAEVAQVQNSFKFNQDPSVAIKIMNSYSDQNKLYVANSVKDPRQRVTLQTIALGGKNITEQEGIDFVAAQQDGRNYKEIDQATDKISDNKLKNDINTNISGATKIIMAQNDANDATIMNGALIQAGVRYAKYLSEKKGQFSLKDGSVWGVPENVTDVVRFINKSYDPMTGSNYIVNKRQVPYTKPEMDNIAQYAVDKAQEYISKTFDATSAESLNNTIDLQVSINSKNILQTKDASGNVYYSTPLTNNFVEHATRENKATRVRKARAEVESMKRQTVTGSIASRVLGRIQVGDENAE